MVASIAFNYDEMREYAAKAGLGLQFAVKEAFLFELMELLAEKDFVLKGGTAINKGFLQGHQRFSEDLDYDTNFEKAKVNELIHSIGWKVKKEFYSKHSIGFMLAYSFNGVEDAVKAEFSFGVKGAHEKLKATSDFLPVSKRVEMYSFQELNAQKEAAMENRREWKDLYDLFWMKELHPTQFKIKNKKEFLEAVKKLQVPKTANAYIPSTKRLNWDEIIEIMKKFAEKD